MSRAYLVGTVGLAALVCVGRFLVPGHALSGAGTYEALAHVWVGGTLLVVISARYTAPERVCAGLCLGAATLLETVMFLAR